jgi:hypothetical protein
VPNLTNDEYERLRGLVRRSPAFTGMRIVVHHDRVEIVEPHDIVIMLRPLVDRVADAPPDRWPELVDAMLEDVLPAIIHGEPDLDGPTEAFLGRVFPRLKEFDTIDPDLSYAPEIAPNLYMLLGLDRPEQIAILTDDRVRSHGFDRLYEAAIDNLFGQLPEVATCFDDDVYVLEGSDYVGSLALVLPWVVDSITDAPDFPHGVLVAVPNHNRLVFHVLRDATRARSALAMIAQVAEDCHAEEVVPLSPRVYWLGPERGSLDLVAEYAGDAHGVIGEDVVRFHSPDFAAALDELDRVGG